MDIEPLETGSIVKIWNGSRGIDYMVVGVERDDRVPIRLGLLRNTCLNSDGTVRANTTRIHKWLQISDDEGFGVAQQVKRVCGTRSLPSFTGLNDFLFGRLHLENLRTLQPVDDVYANPNASDARFASAF